MTENNAVSHPSHYCDGGIETIDYIIALSAPFHLGNVIKYISRAGKKDKNKTLQDIEKSKWYLDNYIHHVDCRRSFSSFVDGISPKNVINITSEDFIKAKKITNNHLQSAIRFIDEAMRNNTNDGIKFVMILNSASNAINKYIEEHRKDDENA